MEFDFTKYVNAVHSVTAVDDLFDHFSQAMLSLGFEVSSFQTVTGPTGQHVHTGKHKPPVDDADSPSSDICNSEGGAIDKIASTETGAFFYDLESDAMVDSATSATRDARLGLCIPLRGLYGSFAVVKASSASTATQVEHSCASVLSYGYAVAFIFYSRFCAIHGDDQPDVHLTNKERRVLQFVAKGYTKNRIAETMDVTNHAIDFHFRNILKKYDTGRITVAVVKAIKGGLI